MHRLFWVGIFIITACNQNTQEAIVTYDTIDSAYITHSATVFYHEPVVYEGTVPCASCTGIGTKLTLYPDSLKYEAKETYYNTGLGDTTYTSSGPYQQIRGTKQDATAIVYQLNPGDSERTRSYKLINDSAIKMLDKNMSEIESSLNYTLIRTN